VSRLPQKVRAWLPEPPSEEVIRSVERLARLDDVAIVALMPDVHLAEGVCVGAVVATQTWLLPDAVGGDIGCGMAAVPLGIPERVVECRRAERILARLAEVVPSRRHRYRMAATHAFDAEQVVTPALRRTLEQCRATQLGTLGSGNHFLELQVAEDGRLWLMVHSGSRALGPAVRACHLEKAHAVGAGLRALDARSEEGLAYLRDQDVANRFACASRRLILGRAAELLGEELGTLPDFGALVSCAHNYVRYEEHAGQGFWIHRKGSISARLDEVGIIPGSMGTESFLVSGRGCAAALLSSSHGAGRAMSRKSAQRRVTVSKLEKEMAGIWFDVGLGKSLVDEAPSAYKPIAVVMRAQAELTRIECRLRPLLCYKGV